MKMSSLVLLSAAIVSVAAVGFAQTAAPTAQPYKLLNNVKIGGAGGFDYVFADSDGRKLYIPRSGAAGHVSVFDLDTLKPVGDITGANGVHGAVVDPKSGHGFCSSNPVVMWDTKTLATIKTIQVSGNPDGIFFEPLKQYVYILSHNVPNLTAINAADGSIVGTVDVGGAPEQSASDGMGHIYVDVEDKNNIAVVDANTMKVTAHYDLGAKGGTPAGLAIDAKNHILFVSCRNPANEVIMDANDGKIITTIPIGAGVDATTFDPGTMEAFVSNRDATLNILKENSPTDFTLEQTVTTMQGAKTHSLDTQLHRVLLIANDSTLSTAPASQPTATPASAPAAAAPGRGGRGGRGRGGGGGGDSFSIFVVGR